MVWKERATREKRRIAENNVKNDELQPDKKFGKSFLKTFLSNYLITVWLNF
jgi:hypothetical protein